MDFLILDEVKLDYSNEAPKFENYHIRNRLRRDDMARINASDELKQYLGKAFEVKRSSGVDLYRLHKDDFLSLYNLTVWRNVKILMKDKPLPATSGIPKGYLAASKVENGYRVSVATEGHSVDKGSSMPIVLEVENVSGSPRTFLVPAKTTSTNSLPGTIPYAFPGNGLRNKLKRRGQSSRYPPGGRSASRVASIPRS